MVEIETNGIRSAVRRDASGGMSWDSEFPSTKAMADSYTKEFLATYNGYSPNLEYAVAAHVADLLGGRIVSHDIEPAPEATDGGLPRIY